MNPCSGCLESPVYLHEIKQHSRTKFNKTDIFDSAVACQTSSPMVADYLFPHSICLSKAFFIDSVYYGPQEQTSQPNSTKLISVRPQGRGVSQTTRKKETTFHHLIKATHIRKGKQTHSLSTKTIHKDNPTVIIQMKAM